MLILRNMFKPEERMKAHILVESMNEKYTYNCYWFCHPSITKYHTNVNDVNPLKLIYLILFELTVYSLCVIVYIRILFITLNVFCKYFRLVEGEGLS